MRHAESENFSHWVIYIYLFIWTLDENRKQITLLTVYHGIVFYGIESETCQLLSVRSRVKYHSFSGLLKKLRSFLEKKKQFCSTEFCTCFWYFFQSVVCFSRNLTILFLSITKVRSSEIFEKVMTNLCSILFLLDISRCVMAFLSSRFLNPLAIENILYEGEEVELCFYYYDK